MSGPSEEQVSGQGIIFMVAGFETTSATLGSLCYQLVKNTEVMERLEGEVEGVIEEFGGRIDHETVSNMPYLEAAIKETLRIAPPVARNDRVCNKDFTYGNITIPRYDNDEGDDGDDDTTT